MQSNRWIRTHPASSSDQTCQHRLVHWRLRGHIHSLTAHPTMEMSLTKGVLLRLWLTSAQISFRLQRLSILTLMLCHPQVATQTLQDIMYTLRLITQQLGLFSPIRFPSYHNSPMFAPLWPPPPHRHTVLAILMGGRAFNEHQSGTPQVITCWYLLGRPRILISVTARLSVLRF